MEKLSLQEKLKYELECLSQGYKYIAGVDEVGRGPLAGPVVCAAVIMPIDDLIEGIDDSKKLSEKKRNMLSDLIKEKAICYNIEEISPEKIDEINILEATKLCMKNALEGLSIKPDVALIDALKLDIDIPVLNIIKGDFLSYSIGAASIIAKVYRDNLMVQMAEKYPQYSFEKHKGYGTAAHIAAIKEFGATPIHRRSFIKKFV
ncbi:MAG TPA: ribonuclease HII [Clostridia bacterium]|nr:ribonuclease HII [Clostridia bacterium]